MNTTELKEKISKLQKAIDSPATPDNFRKGMKETLSKLQDQLKEAEEKEKEKEESEKNKSEEKANKKLEKKAAQKAARKEKNKKQAAERASKKIVVDGKEISKSDADYCEKLLDAWSARREKAKASAKKSKTKPVFERIAEKVETAVEQAIKNIPSKKIADDPKKYIGSFEKLETSMKEFLQDFRSVLGKDYDSQDVQDALKGISGLISKLKDPL